MGIVFEKGWGRAMAPHVGLLAADGTARNAPSRTALLGVSRRIEAPSLVAEDQERGRGAETEGHACEEWPTAPS